MPSVPIEMPSEMPMVLKTTALPPALSTPRMASSASLSICMLHGVTMFQVEAMPTCDFLKSARVKPSACNMARLAARSGPSTTCEEYSRLSIAAVGVI